MEDAIKTAAQGSAPVPQTLQDAATRYGFNLDSSKAVFDAASASGLSLGMDSQDRLILSLDKLTETLGGTPPKFEAALTAGANAAGSRMSDAAFATGGGRGDASAIGDAVGQKIGLAMETLRGELRSQPITVNFPPIQMDGQAVAAGWPWSWIAAATVGRASLLRSARACERSRRRYQRGRGQRCSCSPSPSQTRRPCGWPRPRSHRRRAGITSPWSCSGEPSTTAFRIEAGGRPR